MPFCFRQPQYRLAFNADCSLSRCVATDAGSATRSASFLTSTPPWISNSGMSLMTTDPAAAMPPTPILQPVMIAKTAADRGLTAFDRDAGGKRASFRIHPRMRCVTIGRCALGSRSILGMGAFWGKHFGDTLQTGQVISSNTPAEPCRFAGCQLELDRAAFGFRVAPGLISSLFS